MLNTRRASEPVRTSGCHSPWRFGPAQDETPGIELNVAGIQQTSAARWIRSSLRGSTDAYGPEGRERVDR